MPEAAGATSATSPAAGATSTTGGGNASTASGAPAPAGASSVQLSPGSASQAPGANSAPGAWEAGLTSLLTQIIPPQTHDYMGADGKLDQARFERDFQTHNAWSQALRTYQQQFQDWSRNGLESQGERIPLSPEQLGKMWEQFQSRPGHFASMPPAQFAMVTMGDHLVQARVEAQLAKLNAAKAAQPVVPTPNPTIPPVQATQETPGAVANPNANAYIGEDKVNLALGVKQPGTLDILRVINPDLHKEILGDFDPERQQNTNRVRLG